MKNSEVWEFGLQNAEILRQYLPLPNSIISYLNYLIQKIQKPTTKEEKVKIRLKSVKKLKTKFSDSRDKPLF